METRTVVALPATVAAEVISKFKEIEALLTPYATDMTPEEKASLLKLGDKTIPFVDKTVAYTETAPEFSPSYLEAADFKKENESLKALDQMYKPAVQILQMIEDTRVLAGNNAYSTALIYYQAVKQASVNGITKAKAIHEDLAQRFPGRPKKQQQVSGK